MQIDSYLYTVFKYFSFSSDSRRKWVFVMNSNFLTPISIQPDVTADPDSYIYTTWWYCWSRLLYLYNLMVLLIQTPISIQPDGTADPDSYIYTIWWYFWSRLLYLYNLMVLLIQTPISIQPDGTSDPDSYIYTTWWYCLSRLLWKVGSFFKTGWLGRL